MATSSNNIIIFLIIGIAIFILFGCNLGINAVCKLTGKKKGDPILDFGGGDTGADAPEGEEGPEQYPKVSMSQAMESIADMIIDDISKGTSEQISRRALSEIKFDIFSNYKSDLAEIAEYNDMRMAPFEGRALALYSRLLLEVSSINGIELAPTVEESFKVNLFPESSPGPVTANRARRLIIG